MTDNANPDRELEDLVADYERGGVDRRAFIRRAAFIGLSLPTISSVLAACGGSDDGAPAQDKLPATGEVGKQAEGRPGGTLREGYDRDFSRMDPINTSYYDPAFFALYEAIITNDPEREYVPEIAESW